MTHRVWIVDDHPVVRAGLKAFLDLQDDLHVVAEAGSIDAVRALDAATAPHLVLLDVKLPDGNGLTVLEELLALPSTPRVVILTSFLDEGTVRDAMRRGASGYLLKHVGPEALVDQIRSALRGEMPLDPTAVRALARPTRDPLDELTPREQEVLRRIARGMTNREIGAELGITETTVKTHATSIFGKLGVDGRTQAALLAADLGI